MGFKKPKEVNQLVVSAQLPGRATREGGLAMLQVVCLLMLNV